MEQLVAAAEQINIFILLMARILGVFMLAPVLGSRNIPPQLKIGLSAIVALMVFSVLRVGPVQTPNDLFSYILLVAGEVVVGLTIGFVSHLIFYAVMLAGQAIDMQMGFSIVNVIDPMFGNSLPLMGNFKYILALLILLVTNTHHYIFAALLKSYQYIPLMTYAYHASLTKLIMEVFGGTLVTAVKISLPVVGVLLVTDVAMGILARTVPQMNIFVVGFPVKIAAGLVVILLSLPLYAFILKILFDNSFADLIRIMKVMGG
ncbi:MAG: flagellar biosynthetic protein FliR [Clostridia bacterium]|nr:flagellar biosynthetic protein FliR [Clostridia bacterium]